jgi:hypothetical protein
VPFPPPLQGWSFELHRLTQGSAAASPWAIFPRRFAAGSASLSFPDAQVACRNDDSAEAVHSSRAEIRACHRSPEVPGPFISRLTPALYRPNQRFFWEWEGRDHGDAP